MVVSLTMPVNIFAEEAVAKVDGKNYTSLKEAIENALDGSEVKLLKDSTGGGVKIQKNITIDLGGHTYKIDNPTVGSTGTETSGFQLLADKDKKPYDVTFKNGSLLAIGDNVKHLFQNYSNLTLTDVNVEGNDKTVNVVSSNNGNILFNGSTSITAKGENTAFDAYHWTAHYGDIKVTVDTTGIITGKVKVNGDCENAHCNHELLVKNGTFTSPIDAFEVLKGTLKIDNATVTGGTSNNDLNTAVWANGGVVIINGGTFTTGCDQNGDGNTTIYAKNGGKITINGGTFTSEKICTSFEPDQYGLLNIHDGTRDKCTITVKGGTFKHGFNPANNSSEGKNTNFVASGY